MGGLNMSGYDAVIAAIFVFFMARGLWVGFLRQLTVVIALYVSYVVAGCYHDRLFPFLRGLSENPQVVFLLDYAILFACTYVLVMLLGKGLTTVVQLTIAGWFDRFLGGLFGAVKALFITILLHMVLSLFLAPDSPILSKCRVCPLLSKTLTRFQQVVKDEQLLEVMKKKGPAIPEGKIPPVSVLKEALTPAPPREEQTAEKVVPPPHPATESSPSAPVSAEQGANPPTPVQ